MSPNLAASIKARLLQVKEPREEFERTLTRFAVGDPCVSPYEQSDYARFEASWTRQRSNGLQAIEPQCLKSISTTLDDGSTHLLHLRPHRGASTF